MNWLFGRLLEQAVELIDRKLLMVPELEEPPGRIYGEGGHAD